MAGASRRRQKRRRRWASERSLLSLTRLRWAFNSFPRSNRARFPEPLRHLSHATAYMFSSAIEQTTNHSGNLTCFFLVLWLRDGYKNIVRDAYYCTLTNGSTIPQLD